MNFRISLALAFAAAASGAFADDDLAKKVESKTGETTAVAAAKEPIKFPAVATLPKMKDAEYHEMTKRHGSEILVVNFWATWCGPCVEEIPDFVAVSAENPPSRVRFVGVSLDMDKQIDSHVIPFLKKSGVEYPNYLLDADDADVFIGSVSKTWQGAIPATFIYDANGNLLAEHLTPLTKKELTSAVQDALLKVSADATAKADPTDVSASLTVEPSKEVEAVVEPATRQTEP